MLFGGGWRILKNSSISKDQSYSGYVTFWCWNNVQCKEQVGDISFINIDL